MLKFGMLKQGLKVWIKDGSKLGIEWGTLSAIFSGSESFCANIRQKNDRWNSYIGSGMASACMRFNEGPKGILMNFCIGFAFMYVIDMLVPSDVPTSVEQTAAHEVGSKIPKRVPPVNKKSLTATTFSAKRYVKGIPNKSASVRNTSNSIVSFIKKIIS